MSHMKPVTKAMLTTLPAKINPAQAAIGLNALSQIKTTYDSWLDDFAYRIACNIHQLEKEEQKNV